MSITCRASGATTSHQRTSPVRSSCRIPPYTTSYWLLKCEITGLGPGEVLVLHGRPTNLRNAASRIRRSLRVWPTGSDRRGWQSGLRPAAGRRRPPRRAAGRAWHPTQHTTPAQHTTAAGSWVQSSFPVRSVPGGETSSHTVCVFRSPPCNSCSSNSSSGNSEIVSPSASPANALGNCCQNSGSDTATFALGDSATITGLARSPDRSVAPERKRYPRCANSTSPCRSTWLRLFHCAPPLDVLPHAPTIAGKRLVRHSAAPVGRDTG